MDYIKVEGHTHLKRDPYTNSIVNTNMSEYQEYLNKRNKKSEDNHKIQNLERDLDNIKNDINDIKSMLMEFINGSQQN